MVTGRVDTYDEGWSQEVPTADGLSREQLWREDRMGALLASEPDGQLFVAGCARDQGLPAEVGNGLLGMRERVAVYGGSLVARARPGGGFELVATLPLESP